MSTFYTIHLGRSALETNQKALDVTGHNIANANTPGYSRQIPQLITGYPQTVVGAGQMGSGVMVSSINRVQDYFLTAQMRTVNGESGYWTKQSITLEEIEVILDEISQAGIAASQDDFWQAVTDVIDSPENTAARRTFVERAETLATGVRTRFQQLKDLQANLDFEVKAKVQRINQLAQEVATLNEEIVTVTAKNNQPNDLLDRRDNLINELARYSNVWVNYAQNGNVFVSISGHSLVDGFHSHALKTVSNPLNNGYSDVVWENTGATIRVTTGELFGLLDARDRVINEYMQGLDDFASDFIAAVNLQHQAGFDAYGNPGQALFTGSGALDMAVNPGLIADTGLVAASAAPGGVGDSDNARAILALRDLDIVQGTTPSDFYASLIGELGIAAAEANSMLDSRSLLRDQIVNRRESISGVSLDEEMLNLIRFQRGYEAAARLIATVDEMLDHLINRT